MTEPIKNYTIPEAAKMLAAIYLAAGDTQPAVTLLKEAARADGRDFRPWYALGKVYHDLGTLDESVAAYTEALRRSPPAAEARPPRPDARPIGELVPVEAQRGYYQEHGRLSASRSKAVIKAVNALCAQLRPDAKTLVDAFQVPEAALGDAKLVADAKERVAA